MEETEVSFACIHIRGSLQMEFQDPDCTLETLHGAGHLWESCYSATVSFEITHVHPTTLRHNDRCPIGAPLTFLHTIWDQIALFQPAIFNVLNPFNSSIMFTTNQVLRYSNCSRCSIAFLALRSVTWFE